MNAPLLFTDIHRARKGTLAAFLTATYAPLLSSDPDLFEGEREKWSEFDREAFDSEAVGRCVFLSWREGMPVGFGSYDPRGAPEFLRIGHHCVLPAFRGQGYGRMQLEEIARRAARFSARELRVSTLDHDFFAPARRLYALVGFRTVARNPWEGGPDLTELHLVKKLKPAAFPAVDAGPPPRLGR